MSPVCVCSSLAPRAARAGCRRRLAREKTDPSTWDLTKKSQRERQLQLLLEQMRRGNIRTELTRCLGCMCEVAKLVVKAEVVAAVLLVLATLSLPVMKVLHLVMV